MKKLLTSLMAVMLVLLSVSPAAFASDMKLYHNDNDHYSISIPSDWEYQDIKRFNNIPELKGLSMFAVSKSKDIFYCQILNSPVREIPPMESWSSQETEKTIQQLKEIAKIKLPELAYKESGETYINNRKLIWLKFGNTTDSMIVYETLRNNSVYEIWYMCPIDNVEKTLPKITESINSLKIDDISPNWYWVYSDNYFNIYIDTNSISSYKDPSTNNIHRTVIMRVSSIFTKDGSYFHEVLEFKTENGIDYYRLHSISEHDSNEKFVKLLYYLDNKSPNYNKWTNITIKEALPKIAALLFEKNQ